MTASVHRVVRGNAALSRFRGRTDARVSCPLLIASRLWGEGAPTGAVPICLFTIRNYLFREIMLDFTCGVIMLRLSRSTRRGAPSGGVRKAGNGSGTRERRTYATSDPGRCSGSLVGHYE